MTSERNLYKKNCSRLTLTPVLTHVVKMSFSVFCRVSEHMYVIDFSVQRSIKIARTCIHIFVHIVTYGNCEYMHSSNLYNVIHFK